MKKFHVITLFAVAALTGCGQYGGGSAVVPEVTVLPADLSGADVAVVESSGGGSDPAAESGGSGPGTLTGRVVMVGDYPQLKPLFAQNADIKDREVCAAVEVPNEQLVVGTDNGVQNVFVFMRKAPKGSPKLESAEPLYFDQKNCRFLPRAMIVPVGATLKVLSDDAVAHNTHTNPARNNGVSSLVPANDREGTLELVYKTSENPFAVTCDFHSWMKAYHLPLDHPYGAVTDENGRFEIKDIPSGTHDFVVWHESAAGNFVERKLKVTIKPGQNELEIPYASSKLAL